MGFGWFGMGLEWELGEAWSGRLVTGLERWELVEVLFGWLMMGFGWLGIGFGGWG